jgi:hypothetical protein
VAKSTVDANGYPVLSEAMIDIGVELKGRQASEAELKGVVGG